MTLRARQNGGGTVRNGGGRGGGNGSPAGRGHNGGQAPDPSFSSVVLLAHFDGTAPGNAVDSSSYNRVISDNGSGSMAQSSANPQYGTGSLDCLVNAAGRSFLCADATALRMSSSDFTLEASVYWDATNLTNFSPVFIAKRGAATNIEWYWAYFNGNLYFGYSTDGTTFAATRTRPWTPTAGQWYKLAMVKSGTNLYFFVNGVKQGVTDTIAATLFAGSASLTIGGDGANTVLFDGQIDEVRITKGVARYTADYTPATSAFPNS